MHWGVTRMEREVVAEMRDPPCVHANETTYSSAKRHVAWAPLRVFCSRCNCDVEYDREVGRWVQRP